MCMRVRHMRRRVGSQACGRRLPRAFRACCTCCARAGKTTSARVISSQAAVPLIYLPLEAVLSKW